MSVSHPAFVAIIIGVLMMGSSFIVAAFLHEPIDSLSLLAAGWLAIELGVVAARRIHMSSLRKN